jgi:Protein of unknown function (DUF1460)
MTPSLLALWLLAAPPQGFAGAEPGAVMARVAAIRALPTVRERALAASEAFLGVPYRLDPLGEGPGHPPDEDPRLRFDAVDCQTFLETVIALAQPPRGEGLEAALDAIRYDGAPEYARRLHFFDAQWLPANQQRGYVRDVTAALGGADVVRHRKVVTTAQWRERTVGREIQLADERAPVGAFEVRYLPLSRVLAHARQIPSGTAFAVVREDRPLVPLMVSHLGFIIQGEHGTVARHASDVYHAVVDEDLAHFVERNGRLKRWKVLGLQLLEVSERP